jgi:hypothetical protein
VGYLCLAPVPQQAPPPHQPACISINLKGLVFNFIKKFFGNCFSVANFFFLDKDFLMTSLHFEINLLNKETNKQTIEIN